jgi:hypothetical protein
VTYEVKVGNGPWTVKPADTYNVGTAFVQVRAIPQAGYELTGTTKWDHHFKWAGLCLVKVYPEDPGFVQATCDAPGESTLPTYTIPSKTGVIYSIVLNGNYEYDVDPGVHPLDQGDVLWVIATGDVTHGYVLDGLIKKWGPYKVNIIGDCLVDAPVVEPGVTDQTCVAKVQVSGYITIDDTPHVKYYIGDSLVPATPGKNLLAPGTYSVRAEADPGYTLTGYTEPWTKKIVASGPCDLPTKPLTVPYVSTDSTCVAPVSYTLSNLLGNPAAVIWKVDNVATAQGTYPWTETVKITAAPADGFGFGLGTQTEWTLEFAPNASGCELPTLAYTGGGVPAGGALGGGLLFLGLVAVLAVRRRKTAV